MNLHWIDWTINILFIGGMFGIAIYTRRYMKSVADFLAANRLANRYLLTIATGLPGAISIVASWEMIYAAGFPTQWWSLMSAPVGLVLTLTGFVIYRFRQTRAFTLAQFMEMRYSRRFRIFSGFLCFLSGILNYGIFPAVTARFMIYFFGLPTAVDLGSLHISMFPLVMAIELMVALCLTLSGGQITILMTEFFQGMITMVMFVLLVAFVMMKFSWGDIITGLQMAPEGKSMLDPLKTGQVEDFNIWYFLIGIFGSIYNRGSWQGTSAYNAAPRTPHEAKMAGILGGWRGFAQALLMLMIPLVAYSILHHPKFAAMAQPMLTAINGIQDPAIRNQMTVPIVLTYLLPVGMMGFFAAVIIASAVHTDETYLHSWGTIFVQDVLMPFFKKPFSARAHLWLLRIAIVGVALFGFVFSLLFTLRDYILMFFNLTGAIYLGGAGAVILGGLYWKRGTTAAAWFSMAIGSLLAFGGMSVQQFWPDYVAPVLLRWFPDCAYLHAHAAKFPINGMVIYFYAMLVAMSAYILISLLGPRKIFDMDKMLHRGQYAVAQDAVQEDFSRRKTFSQLLGITPEFTRGDRILFWASFWWSMGWWFLFLAGTFGGLLFPIPVAVWSGFWFFKIWLSFVLGIAITVWFLWGGFVDARQLFRDLRRVVRDEADDGTVTAKEAAHYTPVAGHHPKPHGHPPS